MGFENVIKTHWETTVVKLGTVSYFWPGGPNKYPNQHIPYILRTVMLSWFQLG